MIVVPAMDAELAPSITATRSVPVELFWIFRLDRRLGLVPLVSGGFAPPACLYGLYEQIFATL